MTIFRVHFETGETIDVPAENPTYAREIGSKQSAGKISKVKLVKEKSNG